MTKVGDKHALQDCPYQNTEYFDDCPLCGELSACTCLAGIADHWEIEKIGNVFSFCWCAGKRLSVGVAHSYREAMDSIAHAILCTKEERK